MLVLVKMVQRPHLGTHPSSSNGLLAGAGAVRQLIGGAFADSLFKEMQKHGSHAQWGD